MKDYRMKERIKKSFRLLIIQRKAKKCMYTHENVQKLKT